MADDRMKNDDLQRNMGTGGEGQDFGKQTPGRNPQDDRSTGGQQGGQQKEPRNPDDDDEFGGGQTGGQNRGGQNR